MIIILEIGIPVWKAKDVLPNALNSIVSQTKKNFIVTLSIDGDNEDYSDIISEYQNRGLKIKVIYNKENGGPGAARQAILDKTQCDYIMFLDADDMLMPRAAEVLYREAKLQNYDLIQSGFYRENDDKDTVIQPSGTTITWFHGKIYRTQFLKEKNISFLPGLRVDEDAYFNAVAWNSTESRGQIEEALYLWRNNKNSITRELDDKTYFCQNYFNYIHSQTSALMRIFEINNKMPEYFTANTLMNIYYYYMRAKFYQLNEIIMIEDISRLKAQPWIKNFFNDFNMWQHIINNIKSGQIYDKGNVVFFSETFDKWVNRLLLRS